MQNKRSNEQLARIIATKVYAIGGQTYYVGGYVRDQLLGIDNKDVDIEVHGVEPDALYKILQEVGKPKTFGKNFGIYSLNNGLDIALPRSEKNTGRGHRDFEIYVDPYIGTTKAIQRRDFTINAIYKNVLTDEIIDPFNGVQDIKNKTLRYVDKNSFAEDPLRVLRGCQFAARFNFKIDEETIELCKTIDLKTLSKERVEEELKKALIKGSKPSIFFNYLRQMNQLDYWFKEIKQLIGVEQNPIYHPEGDVYNHTMIVLDKAIQYKDVVSNIYDFEMAALCHDFGKIVTTEVVDGVIHSYKHEEEGLPLVKEFLDRLTNKNDLHRYVLNMCKLHMRPMACSRDKASIKATNKLFDESINPNDLIYLSICDSAFNVNDEIVRFLFDRYKIYQEIMARSYVTGEDLIASGLIPNEDFSKALNYAHQLRLAGVEKNQALAQVLGFIRSLKSN